MSIAIIGFMGTGKTTVALAVAKELGLQFYDTDSLIEQKYGTIADIFRLKGEKYFRGIESTIIGQLKISNNTIISTGGGVVTIPQNMQYLKKSCRIIWLRSSISDIIKRLKNDKSRPLWITDISLMQELYLRREALYKKYADITIENVELKETIAIVKSYLIKD